MNEELAALQVKVNGVIYNPFINLKDHAKALKGVLSSQEGYEQELAKLDVAVTALDQFENLPYGNLERIKGFNKIKNNILKIIKELNTSSKS